MIQKYQDFTRWLDSQTHRERLLVFVAILGAIFLVWDMLLVGPLDARRKQAETLVEPISKEIQALEVEAERLAEELLIDLDEESRMRRSSLEDELKRIDSNIAQRAGHLIPPQDMPGVLKELLVPTNLKLIRLESQPAMPLFQPPDEDDDEVQEGPVFKHAFVMELRGGYLSALRYLRLIEELPWRLFWERLEYEVIQYPEGRIILTVYSLSFKEGWIGV